MYTYVEIYDKINTFTAYDNYTFLPFTAKRPKMTLIVR